MEQKIFDVLKNYKVAGGVYEWTLADVVASVLIEHNDFAPHGAIQSAENILRKIAKDIAGDLG